MKNNIFIYPKFTGTWSVNGQLIPLYKEVKPKYCCFNYYYHLINGYDDFGLNCNHWGNLGNLELDITHCQYLKVGYKNSTAKHRIYLSIKDKNNILSNSIKLINCDEYNIIYIPIYKFIEGKSINLSIISEFQIIILGPNNEKGKFFLDNLQFVQNNDIDKMNYIDPIFEIAWNKNDRLIEKQMQKKILYKYKYYIQNMWDGFGLKFVADISVGINATYLKIIRFEYCGLKKSSYLMILLKDVDGVESNHLRLYSTNIKKVVTIPMVEFVKNNFFDLTKIATIEFLIYGNEKEKGELIVKDIHFVDKVEGLILSHSTQSITKKGWVINGNFLEIFKDSNCNESYLYKYYVNNFDGFSIELFDNIHSTNFIDLSTFENLIFRYKVIGQGINIHVSLIDDNGIKTDCMILKNTLTYEICHINFSHLNFKKEFDSSKVKEIEVMFIKEQNNGINRTGLIFIDNIQLK